MTQGQGAVFLVPPARNINKGMKGRFKKSYREDRPERVRRVRVREPSADVPGRLCVTRVRLGILPHQVSPIPNSVHQSTTSSVSLQFSPVHPKFSPILHSFFRQSIEATLITLSLEYSLDSGIVINGYFSLLFFTESQDTRARERGR
ncbi:unnamed protein product [Nezara viridula]|uniref:Uncharacterized protein n=1 Tax=Nezara viridula TaxID=85310 RepID=A0A9P0HQY7_NEZVI|nr:unnamed protein product [Nezara viridula]